MKRRLVHYNYADEIKIPKRLKKVDQRFMTDQEIGAVLLYLGVVMGPDFLAKTGNLARNIRENRLGVLSTVLTRD